MRFGSRANAIKTAEGHADYIGFVGISAVQRRTALAAEMLGNIGTRFITTQ